MKKLTFKFTDSFDRQLRQRSKTEIIFIRPMYSRLFRIFSAPKYKVEDEVDNSIEFVEDTELIQVLNTICTRYHKGVWYFRFHDDKDILDTGAIFLNMGIPHCFVFPDETFYN